MHRKLFAVLLCLTVIAIAALIIVSHFQNVYRFNCIYSVTLLHGEPENVSISNFRLIVPYPLFTGMKLHAASPLQVWYQIVSTPYGKFVQITVTKIDLIPPAQPSLKNSRHNAPPRYGTVVKSLLGMGVKRVSSKPLNELYAKCSLSYIKNATQNRNQTNMITESYYSHQVRQVPVFVSYSTKPDTVIQLDITLTKVYRSSTGAGWRDSYTASLKLKGPQNGWFNATVYETITAELQKKD